MGNYTIDYRMQLLGELLTIQKETQNYRSSIDLVNSKELIAIQLIWCRDGYFKSTVNDIYNEVYLFDYLNNKYKMTA